MDETFLTVDEIAKALKLNPQTVRNWIDRGELRALRVGSRRVRVRKADFDAFIKKGGGASAPTGQGKRTSVVVYRGIDAPTLQRKVGPFPSQTAAVSWCKQEGLATTPRNDEDWAVIFPASEKESQCST